jgi:hypothetical protein
MQDKVVRSLVIVVLVLGAAALALLLAWLTMAGMMASGTMSGGMMMGQGSAMPMAALAWVSLLSWWCSRSCWRSCGRCAALAIPSATAASPQPEWRD